MLEFIVTVEIIKIPGLTIKFLEQFTLEYRTGHDLISIVKLSDVKMFRFCVKSGKGSIETMETPRTGYGETATKKPSVSDWDDDGRLWK